VWSPEPEIIEKFVRACTQIYRVLKPEGVYIWMTFGQPHFRRPLLLREPFAWSLKVMQLGEAFHYYIYVLTKPA